MRSFDFQNWIFDLPKWKKSDVCVTNHLEIKISLQIYWVTILYAMRVNTFIINMVWKVGVTGEKHFKKLYRLTSAIFECRIEGEGRDWTFI